MIMSRLQCKPQRGLSSPQCHIKSQAVHYFDEKNGSAPLGVSLKEVAPRLLILCRTFETSLWCGENPTQNKALGEGKNCIKLK